jgi:hypothetical protein
LPPDVPRVVLTGARERTAMRTKPAAGRSNQPRTLMLWCRIGGSGDPGRAGAAIGRTDGPASYSDFRRPAQAVFSTFNRAKYLSLPSTSVQGATRVLVRSTISLTARS